MSGAPPIPAVADHSEVEPARPGPGAVPVATDPMDHVASVALGVYVGLGSRDEPPELAGASHFLEHLLFKGTPTRSARDIAMAVEGVGGELNAYTTREHTAFHLRVPAPALELGLDLLTEVVATPLFRAEEVEAERAVILEELWAAEDQPDDVLHVRLWEALFPDHALGRDTLGNEASIGALAGSDLEGFHQRGYGAPNLVVAAAGALDPAAVRAGVAERLPTGAERRPPRVAPSGEPVPLVVERRPTEQVNVGFGWRSLPLGHDDRYALAVANHILGGGTASRLFQEVREVRGLAYTVYSTTAPYADTGALVVGAGAAPARVGDLLATIDTVLLDLLEGGVTEEEHEVALGYLEGSLLLALEDSSARMGRLGTSLLAHGRVIPTTEHLARFRAVTPDDVDAVLRTVLRGPRSLVAVGPFGDDDRILAGALARGAALR